MTEGNEYCLVGIGRSKDTPNVRKHSKEKISFSSLFLNMSRKPVTTRLVLVPHIHSNIFFGITSRSHTRTHAGKQRFGGMKRGRHSW